MQRFALSLALITMIGLGLAGTAKAADPATDTKDTAPVVTKKSCTKSKSCHKGKKKAKKTESTETTETK